MRLIVNETLRIVTPLVFAEAADLVAAHKLCGRDVVVIRLRVRRSSAIAAALGATHAMATRMIRGDGSTGGSRSTLRRR